MAQKPFHVSRFVLRMLKKLPCRWMDDLHCKKIRKIYGRTSGNQLPVPVPLFLRESVKKISHGRTG